MQLANDATRYGAISQWLHWTTAALVVVLLVMGNAFDMEADEPGNALFFWHSSLGILVFVLAAVRIAWFLVSRPPALPRSTGRLYRVLARSTHVALYVLLFALPVSGWLAASSEGAATPFFGLVTVPAWSGSTSAVAPAAPAAEGTAQRQAGNREAEEGGFGEIHEVLGNVLLVLASLHVLAALKHHFVDRDDVLRRMLPRARGSGEASPPTREHGLT